MASAELAALWASSKQGGSSSPSSTDVPVLAVIEPIKAMIQLEGSPPNVEAVREVDRRLRICKNPEKVVGSNAYKRKQAEQERKAEEKRMRKAEQARKAMADGDPFGEEIAKADLDDDDD